MSPSPDSPSTAEAEPQTNAPAPASKGSAWRDARWPHSPWRDRLHEIIFEADTPAGKAFDLALLLCIVLSVLAVVLESVASVREVYGPLLRSIEWLFTLLFTVEYILRLISIRRPVAYATSFFGIVDLMAIIPTYLSLLVAGTHSLLVIRALRLLRIFRILKLAQYVGEAQLLTRALWASLRKITIFLGVVLTLILVLGACMYLIEGPENGFTNIPQAMYWAIVTLTTVGYGDIAPQTILGKLLASTVMILGYAILAVPTGIVTVELAHARKGKPLTTTGCHACATEGHDLDAKYCKYCGALL